MKKNLYFIGYNIPLKSGLAFLLSCMYYSHVNAQEPVTTISPSGFRLVQCLGTIEPMKQPLDKWNFTIQNEVVENRMFPDESKIIEEKTKKKLAQLGKEPSTETPGSPTSAITLVLGHSFAGTNPGPACSDNGTAISNGKFIVHTVNEKITVLDTTGKVLYTNSTLAFYGLGGSGFDSRAVYDSYSDRFIVISGIYTASGVYAAFSATNDPTGTWYKYKILYPSETSGFGDYPYLGITDHDLLLESYCTGTGRAHILQVSKAEGYKGGTLRMKDYIPPGIGVNVSTVNYGGPNVHNNKAYLISANSGNTLSLVEISDSIGGNPAMKIYSIPVPSYSAAGNVPQKGSSELLQAWPSRRMLNAVYANGIIHCTQNTDYNNTGYYHIAYYRVDVNTKKATTYYFGQPNSDVCYPSLALFGTSPTDKTVVFGYCESNVNMYPSQSAVACDDAGNWSAPIKLKTGLGYLPGAPGAVRYGDYSSITRKHNSSVPSAWFSAEYGDAGNIRRNWIAEIRNADPTVSVPEIKEREFMQIYPNPVMQRFTLKLNLEKEQQGANISIYNMQGQLVKTLFEGSLMEGENELGFDKTALATGVYFIKVKSAEGLLKNEKIIIGN